MRGIPAFLPQICLSQDAITKQDWCLIRKGSHRGFVESCNGLDELLLVMII